jgi:hypothetical protein
MLVDASVTLQGLHEPVAVLDVGPSLEGPAVTLVTVSLPLKGAPARADSFFIGCCSSF